MAIYVHTMAPDLHVCIYSVKKCRLLNMPWIVVVCVLQPNQYANIQSLLPLALQGRVFNSLQTSGNRGVMTLGLVHLNAFRKFISRLLLICEQTWVEDCLNYDCSKLSCLQRAVFPFPSLLAKLQLWAAAWEETK
jgi:hypothetical protein